MTLVGVTNDEIVHENVHDEVHEVIFLCFDIWSLLLLLFFVQ